MERDYRDSIIYHRKSPHAPQRISHAKRISRTKCISQIPQGIYFVEKREQVVDLLSFFWRRHPDLNRGITVLQTVALPLGYDAVTTMAV